MDPVLYTGPMSGWMDDQTSHLLAHVSKLELYLPMLTLSSTSWRLEGSRDQQSHHQPPATSRTPC